MDVIATAGHVDHGKSALLRRLTGMEPDRWAEERRRGLTIDLGFVWTELPAPGPRPDPAPRSDPGQPPEPGRTTGTITVAFVDVPGHDSFLPNMLCGVGVVEKVLLVVAADDGWSAQSEEHLEILDLLDRDAVAAVVTKSDLVGEDRIAEVVGDVTRRLATTSLRGAPVIAVDSLSGAGFERLREVLADRLHASADQGTPARQAPASATRLWIDRAFTIKGAGTVVTGMLDAGTLHPGQDVEVAPRGLTGRVRGLQCLGRDVPLAHAGSRVAVNLGGVAHDALGRGECLLAGRASGPDASSAPRVSTAIDVRLRALDHRSIGYRGAWHLHVGTAVTTVRVLPLLGDLDAGSTAPVRLELHDPLPLRAGDRFVLREAGTRRTAGGGIVLDPFPGPRQRGADHRFEHALLLEGLAGADPTEPAVRVRALVDAHGGVRALDELRAILGDTARAQAEQAGLAVLAERVVRGERLARWSDRILEAARAAGAEHAVERARLTSAAEQAGCPRELAAALVERAVEQRHLASHGGRFVHREHLDAYLDARRRRRQAFVDGFTAALLEPPDPAAAAAAAGIPSFEVQHLLDEGAVVASGPLLFAPAAVPLAIELLRAGPGRDGAPFTASDSRQAWGTTRRFALPLLEHLRATGATVFDGTHHRLTGSDPVG